MDISSTSAVLRSLVERAVISKGRLSTSSFSSPLVLLHADPTASSSSPSSTHKAQAFSRHAHFLYHHLLGKLRDSTQYRGVVLVGLENPPRIMYQSDEEGRQEGVLAALDGVTMPNSESESTMHMVPPLDLSSPEAFVEDIRRALPSSPSPSTPSKSRSKEEGKEDKEGNDNGGNDNGEEEDFDEDSQQSIALGIDSLNMLSYQLKSMPATVIALRKLLLHSSSGPFLSPLLAVLHSEGNNGRSLLSQTWRLALEDLATTNVYLYPQDEVSGRCLVLRKSASGKVHEDYESYAIDGNDGTVRFTSSSSTSIAATSKQDKSVTVKGASMVALTSANDSSSKKEAAFLESLPFRLFLTEQERAMRGQVVLPYERQRNSGGQTVMNQPRQPLIYHEVEGGDEDEDEEEYYDDIDDDLDL